MKFLVNTSCGSGGFHTFWQTYSRMEIHDEANSCCLQFANAPTNHKVRLKTRL